MWSLIMAIPGLANGLLNYLQKRADVGLQTRSLEVGADTTINREVILAEVEANKYRAQQRAADTGSLWTAWMLPTVFALCMCHFGSIVFDSLPWFGHVVGSWGIPALPAPFDDYEGKIILSVIGVQGISRVVGKIFSR